MITPQIVKEVRSFLYTNQDGYLALLKEVRTAAQEVAALRGGAVVANVFSRAKDRDESELKAPLKVALKLARKRLREPDAVPETINDVVGLTVVVNYRDFVDEIAAEVRAALARRSITTSEPEPKSESGYHATHIDCTGQNDGFVNLMCEVQIKTMLHNDWGAKTHDMTYKPKGYHDQRLTEMSQIIGDSIEIIERQSSQLRQLIIKQWEVEQHTRAIALQRMFEAAARNLPTHPDTKSRFEALSGELDERAGEIAALSINAPEIKELQARISELCKADPFGWQLAIKLSMIRRSDDQVVFASKHVAKYRSAVEARVRATKGGQARSRAEAELRISILALYVLGAHDDTILACYEALDLPKLTKACTSEIAFNLATFLAERECHLPSRAEDRPHAKAEIDRLLALAPHRLDDEIRETTNALIDIAFSTDPVALRNAIDTCTRAPTRAVEGEEDIAKAYSEYYMRLGWRRLFRGGDAPSTAP